jgi:surface carbohydrate biosynthesis protein
MKFAVSRRIDVSPRRWLLLPVGIKVREFDGHAHFAFEAVERGWGVILGSGVRKHKSDFPEGVLIEANVAPDSCFWWQRTPQDELVGRIDRDGENMTATGNPRFDLHRADRRAIFDERVRKIRKAHAPFLLINTKYSFYNGYFTVESRLDKMRSRGRLQNSEQEQEVRERVAYHKAGFEKFMELTDLVAERFPTHTIVIRPHPYERIEPWQEKAATLPNVKVIREGSVAAWILASEVCIHNNCTTGVEAYFLDRPAISYRPVSDPRFDPYLPNVLSVEAYTIEALFDLVATAAEGGPLMTVTDASAKVEAARRLIPNIEGKLACERILDQLDTAAVKERELSYSVGRLKVLKRALHREVRSLKVALEGGERARRLRYWQDRSEGATKTELLDFLKAAQRVTGRFKRVRVDQLGDGIFCLY